MVRPKDKIRVSVGITAHNEEANIGRLLDALLNQHLHEVEITEIIVVASGHQTSGPGATRRENFRGQSLSATRAGGDLRPRKWRHAASRERH